MYFIFFSFLRGSVLRHKIHDWIFFHSVLEKCCAIFFWLPLFQTRNLLSFEAFSPNGNASFLSSFFLCLWHGFLLVLSCLGSSQLLEQVGLCVSPNSWSFQLLLFKYSFSSILLFLFSWDMNDRKLDFFFYSPLCLKTSFKVCFSLLFKFSCSNWVNYILMFSDSTLCHHIVLLNPFGELKRNFCYCIFQFFNFHFYIFVVLISLVRFYNCFYLF